MYVYKVASPEEFHPEEISVVAEGHLKRYVDAVFGVRFELESEAIDYLEEKDFFIEKVRVFE